MKKICMRCMRTIDKGELCPYCGEVEPQKKLPEVLVPGTCLAERFLIGHMLGRGGFGITYIGYDLRLNRRVAIKEYYPDGVVSRDTAISAEVIVKDPGRTAEHERGKEKFLIEAQTLAEFQEEDGVVDVSDFFEENNTAYIVMEYLNGATLQQCIQDQKVELEELLTALRPVMTSLERIHEKQVVHRDISPDNIMVLQSGKLKLMDFGAAREVDFSDPRSLSVVLKFGFAPLEQYSAQGHIGPWTDIYALCATMYLCITGKMPENAPTRGFDDKMQWPRQMGISIPEEMENVLKKGLAMRWEDRYQSVAELRDALDKVNLQTEEKRKTLGQMVSETVAKKESDRKSRVWSKNYPRGYAQTVVALPGTGGTPPAPPNPPKPPKPSKSKAVAVIVSVLAVAMIGAAVWFFGRGETARPVLPAELSGENESTQKETQTEQADPLKQALMNGCWYEYIEKGNVHIEYIFGSDDTVVLSYRTGTGEYTGDRKTLSYRVEENNRVWIGQMEWLADVEGGRIWGVYPDTLMESQAAVYLQHYDEIPSAEQMRLDADDYREFYLEQYRATVKDTVVDGAYALYQNNTVGLNCYYPKQFVVDVSEAPDCLRRYVDPATGQVIEFCYTQIETALSADQAMEMLVSSDSSMEVTYSASGESWYAVATKAPEGHYYRKALFRNGNTQVAWFDYFLPVLDDSERNEDIEYMESHFSFQ